MSSVVGDCTPKGDSEEDNTLPSAKSKPYPVVLCDSENSTSSMTHDDDLLESDNDIKPFIQKRFPATMGGLSIPHHGLSAAFHGYHAHSAAANINNGNKTPFLLPAEIYKSLFASAVLQKQQQHHHHQYNQTSLSTTMSGNSSGASIAEKTNHSPPPPPPFPRNLLFSCGEKYHQSLQDQENDVPENKINDVSICNIGFKRTYQKLLVCKWFVNLGWLEFKYSVIVYITV